MVLLELDKPQQRSEWQDTCSVQTTTPPPSLYNKWSVVIICRCQQNKFNGKSQTPGRGHDICTALERVVGGGLPTSPHQAGSKTERVNHQATLFLKSVYDLRACQIRPQPQKKNVYLECCAGLRNFTVFYQFSGGGRHYRIKKWWWKTCRVAICFSNVHSTLIKYSQL